MSRQYLQGDGVPPHDIAERLRRALLRQLPRGHLPRRLQAGQNSDRRQYQYRQRGLTQQETPQPGERPRFPAQPRADPCQVQATQQQEGQDQCHLGNQGRTVRCVKRLGHRDLGPAAEDARYHDDRDAHCGDYRKPGQQLGQPLPALVLAQLCHGPHARQQVEQRPYPEGRGDQMQKVGGQGQVSDVHSGRPMADQREGPQRATAQQQDAASLTAGCHSSEVNLKPDQQRPESDGRGHSPQPDFAPFRFRCGVHQRTSERLP